MAKIKRIPATCLQVGMYISEHNGAWIPHSNLRKHGPVLRQDVIDQITGFGVTEIYIDTEKGLDCSEGEEVDFSARRPDGDIPRGDTADFNQERDRALQLQAGGLALIDQLLVEVKNGGSIPVRQVEDMADGIVGSISANQNALACVTRLREKDRYLLEHSFNVAVLMGILARSLDIGGDDLHQLVTGALLHDIGKIRVADTILHKPGRLESGEWEEMKRHVDYGCQVLDTTEGISQVIRDICGQHHERLDGSGYPLGLSAGEISRHGRMAAVVDVYDAITADRVYHDAMTPTLAMKKLVEWSDRHLDRTLVYQFIRCMSIYPAGSLVALDNGRLAVVLEANPQQQDRPRVLVIYSEKSRCYLPVERLDLAQSGVAPRIVKAVEAKDYGIRLGDFI